MTKQLDGWDPGVRVVWEGKPGQIVKRATLSHAHVWVKLDDEPDSCLVAKRALRVEGTT